MAAPRNTPEPAPEPRQPRPSAAVTHHGTAAGSASPPPSAPRTIPLTEEARSAARLMFALALLWLVFLVYPLITLAHTHLALTRLLPLLAGGALVVATYVWAVARAATSPHPQPRWVALPLLTALALAVPLVYGGDWLGGFIYAAVVAGLTLGMRHAITATAALAALAVLTGSLAGSSWWQTVAVAAITVLGGVVMLGLRWLIAINRELRAARAEIGRLAASEERLRLARDLHDAVKQQVFATSLEIGAARALLGRDQQKVGAHLREASAAIGQVQAEINAVIHELRSDPLTERNLTAALRDYAVSWSRQSGVAARLRLDEECEPSPAVKQALFRVAQEALANVAKHSEATEAGVDLACERDTTTLQIKDNGRGFVPAEAPAKGYGLRNMRERVEALGGRVTIESQPGGGTRITATCPRDSTTARAGDHQGEREHL